ncbi:hypothetical protein DXG01_005574 [Tephrocybe rancida]|nr:hypothetical protein DXG01_005574 [Tephrocybe rancida]
MRYLIFESLLAGGLNIAPSSAFDAMFPLLPSASQALGWLALAPFVPRIRYIHNARRRFTLRIDEDPKMTTRSPLPRT